MKQTDFFFSCVIDLMNHSFTENAENAMYTVFEACKSINQLHQYGSSVDIIQIDAILQDHESRFFKPSIQYLADEKTIDAGVKVDISQVLELDFLAIVQVYHNVILEVLDKVKDRVKDFDFEQLKQDLQEAIQAEAKVLE